MKDPVFESCLAPFLKQFIEYKRLQGYAYGSTQLNSLKKVDHLARDLSWQSPRLSPNFFTEFGHLFDHLGLGGGYPDKSTLRVFATYLHRIDPLSSIYSTPFPKAESSAGYVYSDQEIERILTAAIDLKPELRGHTYITMINLMSVTGLRPGEAINLRVEDFDAGAGTLFIAKSKRNKDRLIPISPSSAEGLTRYLEQRRRLTGQKPCGCFFLNRINKPLKLWTAEKTYHKLLITAEINNPPFRSPRLHDWRHTFSVNCLLKWYREGVDVNARLPILATYLGHVGIAETQTYLHVTPILMATSRQRFSEYINGAQNQSFAEGGVS